MLILIFVGICWFWLQSWGTSRVTYLNCFYGAELGAEEGLPARQTRSQRWRIARSWTLSKVADHTGVIIAALASAGMLGRTAFTLVVFGAFPSWASRICWVTTLAHDGQWLGLIVAAYLYKLTRDAFADGGKRRAIGVLWDVGTFWPRASQPFAPPCYMERSVPETVNRLRRALGDEVRGEVKDGAESSDPAADPAERAYIGSYIFRDPMIPWLGQSTQIGLRLGSLAGRGGG